MKLPLHARGRAQAHAPELDEAGGRRLVELVPLAVGRQGQLVELVRRLPPDHLRRPLIELQPHVACDVALRLGDECIEGVTQRAEPEAVVDHLGPLLRDEVFEPRDLFGERDVLERLVGLEQEHGGRSLVDLA